MNFRHWAGGACALTAISLSVTGCGGGGDNSQPASSPSLSTSISGVSGSKAIAAPLVTPVVVDPGTGSDTVTVTDPNTGTTLNNVVVPTDAAVQPVSGQPALVLNAANLNLGVTFGAANGNARPEATAKVVTAPVSYASLYEGVGLNGTPVLRVGINADGSLQNSVAIGGTTTPATYTLNFTNVHAPTKPGKSLVFNNLDFVFQVRVLNGQLQNTLLTSLKGVLPAFGEPLTHDPSKSDWTGGGILFTTDPSANGGSAALFLNQANGQMNKSAVLGSVGTDGTGQAQTQILIGSGGTILGAPCQEVRLTCLFGL